MECIDRKSKKWRNHKIRMVNMPIPMKNLACEEKSKQISRLKYSENKDRIHTVKFILRGE